MGLKVLEIEGQYAFGIMGSLANITSVMNALDKCEMVDVSFDHDPDGHSQYYAVASGRNRNFTIRELPALTKAEFDALQKQRVEERKEREEREQLEKEFVTAVEPNPVPEEKVVDRDHRCSCPTQCIGTCKEHAEKPEEEPCCMTGCAVCDPETFLGLDQEPAVVGAEACDCNGNKTCSVCS